MSFYADDKILVMEAVIGDVGNSIEMNLIADYDTYQDYLDGGEIAVPEGAKHLAWFVFKVAKVDSAFEVCWVYSLNCLTNRNLNPQPSSQPFSVGFQISEDPSTPQAYFTFVVGSSLLETSSEGVDYGIAYDPGKEKFEWQWESGGSPGFEFSAEDRPSLPETLASLFWGAITVSVDSGNQSWALYPTVVKLEGLSFTEDEPLKGIEISPDLHPPRFNE